MAITPQERRILRAQDRAAEPWLYYGDPVERDPATEPYDPNFVPLEIWLMARLGPRVSSTSTAIVIARSEDQARELLVEATSGRERRDWKDCGKTGGKRIGIATPEEIEPRIVEKSE